MGSAFWATERLLICGTTQVWLITELRFGAGHPVDLAPHMCLTHVVSFACYLLVI